MKRFTSFLVVLLAVLCSFSAYADISFKVKIDNPDAVTCTVNGTSKELVAGVNDFTVPDYAAVAFQPVAPYLIQSVVNQAGTPQNVYSGQWTMYCYSDSEGQTYTITTINLDDSRDSKCTVIVDDPTRVEAQLSGFDQAVTLAPGSNEVKFWAGQETHLMISAASYDKPIYEVTLNDEVQTASYNNYNIELTDGCTINITAIVPDKDVTITFSYSEEGEGAVKSAKVDNVVVEDFDGKVINMKAGQRLELIPNTDFKFDEVKLNDNKISWTSGYSYTESAVMNDMHFDITAHPYGMVNYTVKVDDPENVVFYKGYSYRNDILPLEAGENHLSISEADTYVCWTVAKGAYFISALVNGEPLPYGNGTSVKEGDVIEFTTAKIVYDQTAVVWIDDFTNLTDGSGSFSLRTGDDNFEGAAAGYNVIPFYEKMLPFNLSISCYAEGVTLVNKIYVDGQLQTPYYTSGNYASFSNLPVADKSVIKVFVAEEPVECNVTFDAPEGLEATVTYDRIKTLDKLADGLACFKGTEVAIEGGEDLTVKVGETELEKNDDNKFVFTVADPATTVTLADKSSGVESVVISTEADANAAVYNLMGVRVGTRADLNTLPAGIYVLNGQKVIVK